MACLFAVGDERGTVATGLTTNISNIETTRERAVCQIKQREKSRGVPLRTNCALSLLRRSVSLKGMLRAFGLLCNSECSGPPQKAAPTRAERVLSLTRHAVRLPAGRGRANGVN